MVKLAFILLQLILATTAVLTKSIDSGSELQYIGSFKSEVLSGDGSVKGFNENDYYVSPNSASWQSADVDCQFQLGPTGTLVAIETEAEWEFLLVMLENYGFGTTFWTSGRYNPASQQWYWTPNNQELPSWAPWAPGFPSTPNHLLRVLQYYTNRYDGNWRTAPGTQLHRYICEVQSSA